MIKHFKIVLPSISKRFRRNNLVICNYTYISLQMLLLIAMILGTLVQDIASQRSNLKIGTQIQSNETYKSAQETAHKFNQVYPIIIHNNTTKTSSNKTIPELVSINLTIWKNDSTKNYGDWKNQKNRHAYNVSVPSRTNDSNKTTINTLSSDDDLDTSHSRFVPSRISAYLDNEEIDKNYGDDENLNDIENYVDGASSNLSERKAVKELTKFLSKGMSGATDQMRLETLENWKRRQRERKAIKDARAKMFEDILVAAISSHPEKIKKSKKSNKEYSTNLRTSSSSGSTIGLANNADVDPELANDAETVIQHLQGLASAIDVQSPSSYSNDQGVSSADEVAESTPNEGSGDYNESEPEEKPKKAVASHERPLVRQFKKIKNQISQRRKQLDQIKKLFNIDLAINPKDGTLVGKPSKTKKKHINNSNGGYVEYSDDSGSSSRKKSNKENKMHELMGYLKNNPEILASVMAELTVDADPSSKSSLPLSGREEEPYQVPLDEENDSNTASLSNRRTTLINLKHSKHHSDSDSLPWENGRRMNRRLYDSPVSETFEPRLSNKKLKLKNLAMLNDMRNSDHGKTSLRTKSAEALLLESLRERQLMNLARLDMVLAEKQQGSNRSNVYSTSNTSYVQTPPAINQHDFVNNFQRSSHNNNPTLVNQQQINQNNGLKSNNQTTDEEIMDHQNNETNLLSKQMKNDLSNSNLNQNSNSTFSKVYDSSNVPDGDYSSPATTQMRPRFQSQQQQQQQEPQQQQQQQQLQETVPKLKRFRDWRDMGKSEVNPIQYDKNNAPNNNVTWLPQDLTTDSSSALIGAQSQLNYISQQTNHLKPFAANNYNETHHQKQLFSYPSTSSQQVADASVTRPGSLISMPTYHHHESFKQARPLINNAAPMFMSHSNDEQNSGLKNEKSSSPSDGDQEGRLMAGIGGGISNKNNIQKEDGDDNARESSFDEFEPDYEGRQTGSTTIDYFSSYKQDMTGKRRSRPSANSLDYPKVRKSRLGNDPVDMVNDEVGAMWAK